MVYQTDPSIFTKRTLLDRCYGLLMLNGHRIRMEWWFNDDWRAVSWWLNGGFMICSRLIQWFGDVIGRQQDDAGYNGYSWTKPPKHLREQSHNVPLKLVQPTHWAGMEMDGLGELQLDDTLRPALYHQQQLLLNGDTSDGIPGEKPNFEAKIQLWCHDVTMKSILLSLNQP